MIKASSSDKTRIVEILSKSFDKNKSVNYVIKQDHKRDQRIRNLIEYSFDICYAFGEVYLSDDKNACVLVLFPDKKKSNLKSIIWDLKLAYSAIGITRVFKVLDREAKIKKHHPKGLFSYLWYIGVDPKFQKKGIGSNLLQEVINRHNQLERPIYLETSTMENVPWYQKFEFEIFNELEFSYKLFMIKRDRQKAV